MTHFERNIAWARRLTPLAYREQNCEALRCNGQVSRTHAVQEEKHIAIKGHLIKVFHPTCIFIVEDNDHL